MRKPVRLVVLERLTAYLSDVYGTDQFGESFDLTGKVFRGRGNFGDETKVPMISILEAPTPDSPVYAGNQEARYEAQWRLLLQGWTDEDAENPTDNAHWLMAAVEERLSSITARRKDGSGRPVDPDAYLLGGILAGFEFGPGVVRPKTEGVSSKAFFYLPVRVGLAVNVDEPYLSL